MSFEIVFTGVLREGFSRRQGIDTLCHRFGLNFEQVKRLLSGSRQVIKRVEKRQQADEVMYTLWQGGWNTELLLDNCVIFRSEVAQTCLKRQYSSDQAVSIGLPDVWQCRDDLNPRAVLQAGDGDRHQYVVILKQARQELPPALTLPSYATAQLQQCLARVEEGQLLSGPSPSESETLPLYVSEMSAKLDGTSIHYIVAHFQSQHNFYAIFLWCEGNTFDEQRKLFSQIVSSFCLEKEMLQVAESTVEVTEPS
ncbi:hypothetical protein [Microbulbifer thermotolerans]|uniref:hypothetical protein n=1 Tax=Microbulbifer thermotolerans TaxID=252514 RepID=UPI00224B4FD6|nr:hypothetical protein [Microbulbifer thermotolerans]MCX2780336.1 hypothetical protein [Microbulbifer thermotolerans]MCX2805353.1 hypothetical protein [Microbulbifer thermotolerans]